MPYTEVPLRHVQLELGYTLQTWDTNETDRMGKPRLRYEFKTKDGITLFTGSDFCCSPMHAVDSNESLLSLLGFLTLKPGDTDREYFAKYTADQLAFAQGDAEQLQCSYAEPYDEYKPTPFVNLDDWSDDDEHFAPDTDPYNVLCECGRREYECTTFGGETDQHGDR